MENNQTLFVETKKQLEVLVLRARWRKRKLIRDPGSLTSKQFWRLAKRAMKKKSQLDAIKDGLGNLHADIKEIKAVVLRELAFIVNGKHSKIFASNH